MEDDQLDQQVDQVGPQPEAALPQLPFGQPDALRLQRLTYGYADLQNKVASNDLSMDEAKPAMDELLGQIGPLTQRKQATEAMQWQKQTIEALHGLSMQQAVSAANMRHNAEVFPDTIQSHFNHLTGQATDFYQKKPGEWEPIPEKSPENAAGAIPAGEAGGPSDPNAGAVASADPNAGLREQGPQPQEGAANPPKFDPNFEQTITNGPYTDTYRGGQLTSTNRPTTPDQQHLGGFTPEEIAEAQRNAAAVTWGMRPGIHREVAWNRAMQQSLGFINSRNAADKRAQRNAAILQQKETAKANEEKGASWLKEKDKHVKAGIADYIAQNATETNKHPPIPDSVRSSIEDQAKERADQDIIDAHGEQHLPAARREARAAAAALKAKGEPVPPETPITIDTPNGPMIQSADAEGRPVLKPAPATQSPAQGQPTPQPAATPRQGVIPATADQARKNLERIRADEQRRAAEKKKAQEEIPEFDEKGRQLKPSYDTGFGGMF